MMDERVSHTVRRLFLFFTLAILLLTIACGGSAPTIIVVTATPVPATSVPPTATLAPTDTPRATDTPAATDTPRPTATPTPTETPPSTATATTAPTLAPSGKNFGPIRFAVGIAPDNSPVDVREQFPDGITLLYATFPFQGMQIGQTVRYEWLRDGQVDVNSEEKWSGGASGQTWANLFDPGGFSGGNYQLNLYLDNVLQQSGKFAIEANPAGEPDFGPITFAQDADANGKPVNALPTGNPTFPAGIKLVNAFFNGVNVPPGTTFTMQWLRNGELFFQSNPVTWNFSPNELVHYYVLMKDGSPLPPGTFEFKVNIGTRLVNLGVFFIPAAVTTNATAPATVVAVNSPTPNATRAPVVGFGAPVFAANLLDQRIPVDVSTTFPDGISVIYAVFDFKGLKDGQLWRAEWFLNGELQRDVGFEERWNAGEAGTQWIVLKNQDGIDSGQWQLNLYLENQLQQQATFTILNNPEPDFGPIIFAAGVDANGNPVDQVPFDAATFAAGTTEVYSFFSGVNVPQGTEFSTQWFRNGEVYTQPLQLKWAKQPDGTDWNRLFVNSGALPDGAYEFKMFIGDQVRSLGSFSIEK
jgi:hypothetical protein